MGGIVLKWKIPDTSEVTYDYTEIYSSTSESGTYTLLATQLIADNTYFDITGSDTTWYKIRFKKLSTLEYSPYSSALQGSKSLGYCNTNDVRYMTNLLTTDVSDSDLYELIKMATYELNAEINTEVIRERIEPIDDTRSNDINGTNTTYYVQNWKERYIADSDNDGDVDISDITVYAVDSAGTETTATVSSITPDSGKFVLSTAYSSSYALYVSYKWCYASNSVPDKLVKLACIYLAAAYAYAKINVGKAPTASFGNMKIYRDMDSFDKYYKRYQSIVNNINDKMLAYSDSVEI